jgi:short-subunit dehydrogenase
MASSTNPGPDGNPRADLNPMPATQEVLIAGGSRGLGLALAKSLADDGVSVTVLSRSQPAPDNSVGSRWIPCDLADSQSLDNAVLETKDANVDTVIFNAGIWERAPFERLTPAEIKTIIDTDLTAAVVLIQALLPQLARTSGQVILIGSTCGLENEGATAVAYTAAKFGLRGLAHSLREVGRNSGVRVSILNIGSTATDIPYGQRDDALDRYAKRRMPVEDVVTMIKAIRSLSVAACVKEIHMPATFDTDV